MEKLRVVVAILERGGERTTRGAHSGRQLSDRQNGSTHLVPHTEIYVLSFLEKKQKYLKSIPKD